MNVEELTIGQAKALAGLFNVQQKQFGETSPHPWTIGGNYLIRTVTMAQTGRLVAVYPNELVLEDACWIADTGRFAQAVASGIFDEVEPFAGPVIVGRGAIVDACQIPRLPKEQQ